MKRSAPAPSTDSGSLLSRCHENTAEAYRVFARTTPGGRIEERDGLVLTDCLATDSMGNVSVVTRASPDPGQILSRVRKFYSSPRRPWSLLAFPEAAPSLERAARQAGLHDEGRFPGLVLDAIPTDTPPVPEGVEVRTVSTPKELQTFEETASRAYEVASGPVYPGWLTYPGFSFHLAYHRGRPVATATLVASHGIAGIVYVGTVPEGRGKGFGRAVVWAAVEAGRALGCEVSALWATPMGQPMYERMGFRPQTEYRIWSPPESPLPRAFAPIGGVPVASAVVRRGPRSSGHTARRTVGTWR